MTDGRRSGVRVRTLASPARAWDAAAVDLPSLCSEGQGGWGEGCLGSEPVQHPLPDPSASEGEATEPSAVSAELQIP